ncbi:uncharacterized protein LOC119780001 [Cyprinodon tularosa]|uniref:uncharacterized protein LOC119780001 n=1 Tax=Cyprinodon tularosa TaxID=77115 RepID=UPI0018E2302A|nr:uncharacterized protein LOC119780001 [Cyprinodon tularosa]
MAFDGPVNIDSSTTHSVDILQRTVGMTTSVPVSHRLLLKTENTSLPLCFDVIGAVILKLLHHPNKELYVNGQLDSITNGGFSTIAIHLNADEHVEVNTEVINIQQGQSTTRYIGQDPITVGSFTVIQRDKEIDVAVEDVRLVIYVHEKNGNKFLWPVLRQKPFANNTEGILALKPRDYEEVQQQSDAKLKIKNREISVSSSTAADYSITNPLTVQCWLLSADLALERTLNDYINSLL